MANRQNLGRLVQQYFPGVSLKAVRQLTGGVSAKVYCLELQESDGQNRRVVLRIHGNLSSRLIAKKEFELLSELYSTGLPVPKPLYFSEKNELFDSPYLILSFVEGSTNYPDTNPDSYIDRMAQTLVLIHRFGTGSLPVLPTRLDPMEEILDFLPDGQEWLEIKDFLTKIGTAEFKGKVRLLHGDYWPANLIISGSEVAAIIDWEDAAIGDPLSDIATACLELRHIYGKSGLMRFKNAYDSYERLDEKRLALWLIYVASAAQNFMSDWELEPSQEAHMRQTALQTIREAASFMISDNTSLFE